MHYKNGRLAAVGDPVIGTLVVVPTLVVGTVLEITPDVEAGTCDLYVAVTRIVEPVLSHIELVADARIHREFIPAHGQFVMVHNTHNAKAARITSAFVELRKEWAKCSDFLHAQDVLTYILETVYSHKEPDLWAKALNFSKWNSPVPELPPEQRPWTLHVNKSV